MQGDYRKRVLFDENILILLQKLLNEEDYKQFKYYLKKLPYEKLAEIIKNLINNKCIQIKI